MTAHTPIQSGGAAVRDPKGFLRRMAEDDDGALPVMEAALCAALLDPVNHNPADRFEEAMSHFDGVANDVRHALGLEEQGSLPIENGVAIEDAVSIKEGVAALNDAILTQSGYGGDGETYDDLKNGNLFRVIERRRGLPVALGLIYLHVGRLAGFTMQGLSFPGHFLVQIESGGERGIIDPFLGGVMQDAPGLRALLKSTQGPEAELTAAHYRPVSDRAVLLRLQNNMKLRLLQKDFKQSASEVLEIMLMISPDAPELWREAGVLHASMGNLRAAIASLNNYLDVETRDGQRAQVEALIAELTRKMN